MTLGKNVQGGISYRLLFMKKKLLQHIFYNLCRCIYHTGNMIFYNLFVAFSTAELSQCTTGK